MFKPTCILVLCLVSPSLHQPQGGKVVDVTYVGDLTDTDHNVSGKVYILNQNKLVIDEFTYDGDGFGVYINVATRGKNLDDYESNRISLDYPKNKPGEPLEKKFTRDDPGQLVIDLKQKGIKADRVKWLSVWCTVFTRSFGHVVFPKDL